MINHQDVHDFELLQYPQSEISRLNTQQDTFYTLHGNQKSDQGSLTQSFITKYEQNFFKTSLTYTSQGFQYNGISHQNLRAKELDGLTDQLQNIQRKDQVTKKKRAVKLLITSIANKKKWNQCLKGNRFQTKNICKHLFTQTAGYLKKLAIAHELNNQERQKVSQFLLKKKRINLNCFNELFSSKQLRSKCLTFYESNELVTNVMNSKADLKSKLIFLKYLQKIRSIPLNQDFMCWKK